MRLAAIPAFLLLAAVCAHASACSSAAKIARPGWTLDHYVYDASLRADWEVLVDCNHPQAPPRMKLAVGRPVTRTGKRTSKAPPLRVSSGARVEVENSAGSSASIRLSGTAMETAFSGQSIHVRLSLGGRIVKAVVRGPHRVELAAAVTPVWGEP